MASLTIRQLDDGIKQRLRRRAAARGVSMEEEARRAIQSWVGQSEPRRGLATRIRERVSALGGGIEFDVPDDPPYEPSPLE